MNTIQADITVPNQTSALEVARRHVLDFLAGSPFPERDRRLLVLAIDEAITSNVLFSEACGRDGETRIFLDLDATRLKVFITDTGHDTDPENEEGFEEYARNARKYEMGIFLIRQIVDEMRYIFKKGFQNDLELIRFVPSVDRT